MIKHQPGGKINLEVLTVGALIRSYKLQSIKLKRMVQAEASPAGADREAAVRLKFNPIAEAVRGRQVALVDDSLVRGTTARVLTELLRSAGAAGVHLCIASPPYRFPCYYGIDIPVVSELAAPGDNLSYLAASIGADSVTFARPEDLYDAAGRDPDNYCTACFTGCYPDESRPERGR